MSWDDDPHVQQVWAYFYWMWIQFGKFIHYLFLLWFPVFLEKIGPGLSSDWNQIYYLYRDFLLRASLYGLMIWGIVLRLTYLFSEMEEDDNSDDSEDEEENPPGRIFVNRKPGERSGGFK